MAIAYADKLLPLPSGKRIGARGHARRTPKLALRYDGARHEEIVTMVRLEPHLFRSTVPYYERYRVPYPDALIAVVAVIATWPT